MGFFKSYDMRGTFGVDFDLETVFRAGRALPDVAGGRRWLVGMDCRLSSRDVSAALVAGLESAGAEVDDLGLATTPMVYFRTAEGEYDGSVMVTASHNPPGDNGLKVSRRGALPMGYDSGLSEVEARVAADGTSYEPAVVSDIPPKEDFHADYVKWLKDHAGGVTNGLKYAVDCSDGMAGLFARDLFPDAAMLLNCNPDGHFPHHSPNPLLASAREQISAAVREGGLDCGVIFDGDADRCMFVDENGDFIQPDYLIPVLADTFTVRDPVIHDVRTSRAVIEAISEHGRTPVMGKVGHAYAKRLLRECGAVCGGELAGHYYFRDFHCCDSGELAALRLLAAFARAKTDGMRVSEFMLPLTSKYVNSGELNFTVEDKLAAVARALEVARKFGEETGRSDMDGFRIEYACGWISLRQSNTEPYLRLVAECDTSERLAEWLGFLRQAISG